MPKTVDLRDAVSYLRELLAMDKTRLLREVNFKHHPAEKLKKTDMIAYAFERRFDSKTEDPTVAHHRAKNNHPFSIAWKRQP